MSVRRSPLIICTAALALPLVLAACSDNASYETTEAITTADLSEPPPPPAPAGPQSD